MNNKGSMIPLVVTLLIVLAIVAIFAGLYNSLVQKDLSTENAWADVQSAYQRRIDLIPNLVATVQGAANFEKSTYVAVTEARTQWLNAQGADEKIYASQQLDSALSRLLVSVENYPDLKANQNFLALQDQLEGTENRIKFERDKYNEAVKTYKTSVRSFPTNIMAGMFGFSLDKYKPYEAQSGADKAPQVKF